MQGKPGYRDFMLLQSDNNQAGVTEIFKCTLKYLDDFPNFYDSSFEKMIMFL